MADEKDAQSNANHGDNWYLQKQDGSEYGPETLETMARWAAESRLVSGNKLSTDRKEWIPVEDIPELDMNWLAELADGRRYGPFNICATRDLVAHKVLPENATLTHRQNGKTTTVSAYLEEPQAAKTQASENQAPTDLSPKTKNEKKKKTPTVSRQAEEVNSPKGKEERQAKPDEAQPTKTNAKKTSASTEAEPSATEDKAPAAKKKRTQRKTSQQKTENLNDVDLFGNTTTESKSSNKTTATADIKTTDKTEASVTRETASVAHENKRKNAPTASAKKSKTKDPESVVNAKIEAIKKRLAESDTERRAAVRQLNEANATLRQLESERDGARKIAVTQDAQFKNKLNALEKKLEEVRSQNKNPQQDQETPTDELNETSGVLEERLNAAMGELKKARNGEVKAAETLKTVEQKLAHKTAIQDKRVQDLVSERNSLAHLVETETLKIKQLRAALVALGVVIVILLITLMTRGCHTPDSEIAEPISVETIARSGSDSSEAASTGTDRKNGVVRRVPFPVIRGTEGVRVMYSRTGSKIVFDDGIFTKRTELSTDAKRILTKLAPQFRPFLGEYELLVQGHTDNQRLRGSGPYRNNTELAQARAGEAARFLSDKCGIPLSSMRVTSAGSSNPPYPNDTSESRARNRTVVLKLLRHASN
ncbi:MAG: OmpA family protein [Kiritimatiellae bacterium]|nr:OmpA family protein [Kiritimatiellia bacterium]